MKLIVVSNPVASENEAEIVNMLFDKGLELFHLRKPHDTVEEVLALLKQIKARHLSKIVLHQHHSLAEQIGSGRIHFTEIDRMKTSKDDLKKLTDKFILSTSVHSMSDLNALPENFDYTFLGPVFESISKKEYKPQPGQMLQLVRNEKRKTKIIAIGGISVDKIKKAEKANFDGVALLGTIWNDPKNAVSVFEECYHCVNM